MSDILMEGTVDGTAHHFVGLEDSMSKSPQLHSVSDSTETPSSPASGAHDAARPLGLKPTLTRQQRQQQRIKVLKLVGVQQKLIEDAHKTAFSHYDDQLDGRSNRHDGRSQLSAPPKVISFQEYRKNKTAQGNINRGSTGNVDNRPVDRPRQTQLAKSDISPPRKPLTHSSHLEGRHPSSHGHNPNKPTIVNLRRANSEFKRSTEDVVKFGGVVASALPQSVHESRFRANVNHVFQEEHKQRQQEAFNVVLNNPVDLAHREIQRALGMLTISNRTPNASAPTSPSAHQVVGGDRRQISESSHVVNNTASTRVNRNLDIFRRSQR
jgi:hypothetical protein